MIVYSKKANVATFYEIEGSAWLGVSFILEYEWDF